MMLTVQIATDRTRNLDGRPVPSSDGHCLFHGRHKNRTQQTLRVSMVSRSALEGHMIKAERRDTLERAARAIFAGCVDTEETLTLVADLESIGRNRAARAISAGCVDTKDTLAIVAELKAASKE